MKPRGTLFPGETAVFIEVKGKFYAFFFLCFSFFHEYPVRVFIQTGETRICGKSGVDMRNIRPPAERQKLAVDAAAACHKNTRSEEQHV